MARSTKKRTTTASKRPTKAGARKRGRLVSDTTERELDAAERSHQGRRGVHRTEAEEAQERAAGGEIRGPVRQR